MYPVKFALKYLLVSGFGISGVLSLSRGFGMPIPFLEYGSLEAWNVLAGAGLLAVGLCLAFFWPVQAPRVKPGRGRSLDGWLLESNTGRPQLAKHH